MSTIAKDRLARVRCRMPLAVHRNFVVWIDGQAVEVDLLFLPAKRWATVASRLGDSQWHMIRVGPFMLGLRFAE